MHSRSRKNCLFIDLGPPLAPHRASIRPSKKISFSRVMVFSRIRGGRSRKGQNAGRLRAHNATPARDGQQSFERKLDAASIQRYLWIGTVEDILYSSGSASMRFRAFQPSIQGLLNFAESALTRLEPRLNERTCLRIVSTRCR